MFIGHFPQKGPIISGSFAKKDLQLKASYGSTPPCTYVCVESGCRGEIQPSLHRDTLATHLQHAWNTAATHLQHICNTPATPFLHRDFTGRNSAWSSMAMPMHMPVTHM